MTGADETKLLGASQSPFVLRARIALNLKGISYELLPETLGNPSELLIKNNPVYKKIPVLLHNGKPICESMIIVQYIDEVWSSSGPAILPNDVYDRANARFWSTYIDEKCFPGVKGIFVAQSDEAMAESAKNLSATLPVLEEAFMKCSKGKGFFGGDTIGFVDIALGSSLAVLQVVGQLSGVNFLDEVKTPLLVGWAERFRSDPAVREVIPSVEELMAAYKMVRAFYTAPPPA